MGRKISRKDAIAFILEEMRRCSSKATIMAKNGKDWLIAQRTFERYYKEAEKQHLQAQEQVNKEKEDLYKQREIERQKSVELDRDKVVKYSSTVFKIALKNVLASKDGKDIAYFCSINESYRRLMGFDAPAKTAATFANGKDLPIFEDDKPDLSMLTDKELVEMIRLQEKALKKTV